MTAQTKNLFLWSLLNFSLSYNALFSFGIVLKPLISMTDFSLNTVKMKVSSKKRKHAPPHTTKPAFIKIAPFINPDLPK